MLFSHLVSVVKETRHIGAPPLELIDPVRQSGEGPDNQVGAHHSLRAQVRQERDDLQAVMNNKSTSDKSVHFTEQSVHFREQLGKH